MKPLALSFVVFCSCVSAVAQDLAPAYVLDSAGKTVTAIDLASGKTIGSAAVSGRESFELPLAAGGYAPQAGSALDTLHLSPDGSRLIRIDPGAQKVTFRYGMHPTEKSIVTLIDAKTMKVVASIDAGWGLSNFHFTPDKKVLVAVCAGYHSQKPEETLPSEIVILNTETGQELGRIPLTRTPDASLLSKDGGTVMLFYARKNDKHASPAPAELQFLSVQQHSVLSQITLDGGPDLPVLAPTGDYLYLIEKGVPSLNPGKNTNGRIHAISIKAMKEEAVLDAGSDPKGVLADDAAGQTLVLSNGPPAKGAKNIDGELRILRGAQVANTLQVASMPQFIRLSPDRKRIYIAGLRELTVIDSQSLRQLGRLPQEGMISELAFAPDGKRAFALHPASSKLSIFDLDSLKLTASVTTGRGGVKFAKALGAAALSGASAASAYGRAYTMAVNNGGYGFATYQIFTVAPANTSIAVRPDGAFVYVLNSQTNDVTVVCTSNSEVVDKLAAGGRRLQLLNGGSVLAVFARNTLHRVDTASQKALPEVPFEKNISDVRLSPDGRNAVALVAGSVILLNGSTGEVRARFEGFKRPRQAVFPKDEREEEAEDPEPAGSSQL